MKKIWIDVRTPKQAIIASHVYYELSKDGFDFIVTTRNYDYTISNLERQGITPIVIGDYGESLKEKLLKELERGIELTRLISEEKPCVLFSYPSPSASRVAFGLRIPHIVMYDAPHAMAANRLDFPLASVAIYSVFASDEMHWYVLDKFTTVITYRGVDELIWLKSFKPNKNVLKELGVREGKYVIVRPEESKAHYYPNEKPYVLRMIDLIKDMDYTPVILPRYRDQWMLTKEMKDVIVPEKALDGPSMEYFAALVITGGMTMAREAALLGTPSISLFPIPIKIDKKLKSLGFPLNQVNRNEGLKLIKKILSNPGKYKVDTVPLLQNLESPLPLIKKWIFRLCDKK